MTVTFIQNPTHLGNNMDAMLGHKIKCTRVLYDRNFVWKIKEGERGRYVLSDHLRFV